MGPHTATTSRGRPRAGSAPAGGRGLQGISAAACAVLGLGLLAAPGAAAAAGAPAFRIDHAAARVVVIPENRSDVVFTIDQGRAGLPPLTARRDGGVVVLDGGLGGSFGLFRIFEGLNCHRSGADAFVSAPGHGRVPVSALPLVTVRAPLNVVVRAGGAVYGDVGPSREVDLTSAGCGDWRVKPVEGALRINVAGSGDVRGEGAGDADIGVTGSGDVVVGQVRGLSARVAGSGSVTARAVRGPVKARVTGSGDITVERGEASDLGAVVTGSGNVVFHGAAASLSAVIAGSGDVTVDKVSGPVSRRVAGSGSVNVGR